MSSRSARTKISSSTSMLESAKSDKEEEESESKSFEKRAQVERKAENGRLRDPAGLPVPCRHLRRLKGGRFLVRSGDTSALLVFGRECFFNDSSTSFEG